MAKTKFISFCGKFNPSDEEHGNDDVLRGVLPNLNTFCIFDGGQNVISNLVPDLNARMKPGAVTL